MTRCSFRSALFGPALYALTLLMSLWVGTAQAAADCRYKIEREVAPGVKYYECFDNTGYYGNATQVHVVTIDRSLPGWRMHILAHPTNDPNDRWDRNPNDPRPPLDLKSVETLSKENYALVAINGYFWAGDEGYCNRPDFWNCPSNPTGVADTTVKMWGEDIGKRIVPEAMMGFSGLEAQIMRRNGFDDGSTDDESALPENSRYLHTLYGSERSIFDRDGSCKPSAPDEVPNFLSAVGYTYSRIILVTTQVPRRAEDLCEIFNNFYAAVAVLNDGGPSAELYVGGSVNRFINPSILPHDRKVAYAIGLVPVGAQGNTMRPNDTLIPGQSIFSANGKYKFIYQYDGNLVLYRNSDGHPLWASNTHGQTTRVAIMQTDGNLVVYNPDRHLWNSVTWGNPGSCLKVQDDGNVVIYAPDARALWATNTVQQADLAIFPGCGPTGGTEAPLATPTPPLYWSSAGPIAGKVCTQIVEPSDPDTWNDNYLCADRDIGLVWRYAGPIGGMVNVQWLEAADPHTWRDNYMATPVNYGYQWSSAGPIAGKQCVQILEAADPHTWNDNYVCWPPAPSPQQPPPSVGWGQPCYVSGGTLWCENSVPSPILAEPHDNSYWVDNLWSGGPGNPSWFSCYEKDYNGNTWYGTQGDIYGNWGFVSAMHVKTYGSFDSNPHAYGMPGCHYGE